MLEEKIRNLVLHSIRIERFRTISGRRDPSLSRAILTIGALRTTVVITEVLQVYTCVISERSKYALSGCRLSYIDFHSDCHTDCHTDCPVDCRNDFCIDCWIQIGCLISGA